MGPCLTCHPQLQRGLLERGAIFEVAVERPIIQSADIVYPHCGLTLGQPSPHQGRPSAIPHHLLFLHVLAFLVHVHRLGRLVSVPPHLHILNADVRG